MLLLSGGVVSCCSDSCLFREAVGVDTVEEEAAVIAVSEDEERCWVQFAATSPWSSLVAPAFRDSATPLLLLLLFLVLSLSLELLPTFL